MARSLLRASLASSRARFSRERRAWLCKETSTMRRTEKSRMAVPTTSTSTNENNSLVKTFPVTPWLQPYSATNPPAARNRPQTAAWSDGAGNLEAVARAANRLQISRVFRIALDLLADAAHVDVYRTRG